MLLICGGADNDGAQDSDNNDQEDHTDKRRALL
jgi:hypothetical protein